MRQSPTDAYGKARDHYAKELLGGRSFVRWTWMTNAALVALLAAETAWVVKVTHESAGRVRPYVVAYDNAAHPVPLSDGWTPTAGPYLEIGATWVRYVRSRPVEERVVRYQREWARARTARELDPVMAVSLAKLDEDLGGDGMETELVSAGVERADANSAVLVVRWRERTAFRAGGRGPWHAWSAIVALTYDRTRDRAEDVIPNPMRIYVNHFEPSLEQAK